MKSKGINSTDRNNNSADIRFYETKVLLLSRFSVLLRTVKNVIFITDFLQIYRFITDLKCEKEHNFIDFYRILFQKL